MKEIKKYGLFADKKTPVKYKQLKRQEKGQHFKPVILTIFRLKGQEFTVPNYNNAIYIPPFSKRQIGYSDQLRTNIGPAPHSKHFQLTKKALRVQKKQE